MSGLSKLGTALTIVFVISLVALLAELFYILWRRRRRIFHSQNPVTEYSSSSSKEFFYFLFCNNGGQISRVEPHSTPPPNVNSAGSCPEDDNEMEVIDVFKLLNQHGPSRVLFTIKEEDRENDVDSDKDTTINVNKTNCSKRLNLEDCFKAADNEEAVAVAVAVGDDHMTPFSTPCESPVYFTPLASPAGGRNV